VPEKKKPTEADWNEAIVRFQFFRRMEKPADLRRAKRLPRLLSDVAQEIYDTANELERTGKLVKDLADYSARKIEDRIAFNGYAFEVRERFAPLEFLDELPELLASSPASLRRWAHGLKNNADRAQLRVGLYEECVEMLRGPRRTGRFPVGVDVLVKPQGRRVGLDDRRDCPAAPQASRSIVGHAGSARHPRDAGARTLRPLVGGLATLRSQAPKAGLRSLLIRIASALGMTM
jgi:hypothetical protein